MDGVEGGERSRYMIYFKLKSTWYDFGSLIRTTTIACANVRSKNTDACESDAPASTGPVARKH